MSNFFQCPKENLGKESVVFVPLSAFQSDREGWVVGRLAVEPTISHTTPHLVLLLRLKPVTLSTREESYTESVNELSPHTESRIICNYHECGLLSSHAPIRTNFGLIFPRTYHLKISIIEVLLHTFEKNILEANICLKEKQDQNMNLGVLLGLQRGDRPQLLSKESRLSAAQIPPTREGVAPRVQICPRASLGFIGKK